MIARIDTSNTPTFRQQMDTQQYQCCLNVYFDPDAYTDCELETIAQDANADPVFRQAARTTLATRERESVYNLVRKEAWQDGNQ